LICVLNGFDALSTVPPVNAPLVAPGTNGLPPNAVRLKNRIGLAVCASDAGA
jgi:hypothetical protein